jgi:hypothetical protein
VSSPDEDKAKAEYKAKLQSLAFGKVPGGNRSGKFVFRPKPNASWEAGVKGETRADGSFMPYLDQHGSPIGVKQWGEKRHEYEARLTELRNPPKD